MTITSNKFITLTDSPEVFGSEFNGDYSAINDRIQAAAETAGVRVVRNVVSFTDLEAAGLVMDGSEEIEWFSHWCAAGYRYNTAQWSAWFRKQLAK